MNTDAASQLAGIERLWTVTRGHPRVHVAVLDGGADLDHPAFAGARLRCAAAGDVTEHGTHVASILFGQHGSPVRGIAPLCAGTIIPIYDDDGRGGVRPCTQVALAHAITSALAVGAHVINISGGQPDDSGGASAPILSGVLELCARTNVAVVAAAGNDGCACVHVPAALHPVLAVGACDHDGNPLASSNWGAAYANRGVVAPGLDVLGAIPGGGVALRSGTSFSAAIVSGVIALIVSDQLARGESPDPAAAVQLLLATSAQCADQPIPDCRRLLAGRLDLETLLERMEGGDPLMSETPLPEAPQPSPGITPSCGCGGGDSCTCGGKCGQPKPCGCGAPPPLSTPSPSTKAYAIARLGYDFGNEARRDSIAQMGGINPSDPRQLLEYLDREPWAAASILWTLNLDATPIYIVQPVGAYAGLIYERLREFLRQQLDGKAERVSIAGYIGNDARLLDGQSLPLLFPDPRGMFSWTTDALTKAADGNEGLRNFLDRVYYELRNLGRAPQDRALNYAATNAYQAAEIFRFALDEGFALDCIGVDRSPICRPESDCWDVRLVFFDPKHRLEVARRVYRFTIDVSDVIPVSIGGVQSWSVY